MRRLGVIAVLSALLGMAGGLMTASPALARGPNWQVFPAPPFTLPATYCGFDVEAAAVADKEFVTILQTSDGSTTFLVTGQLTGSFTNLETGKTVTGERDCGRADGIARPGRDRYLGVPARSGPGGHLRRAELAPIFRGG